MVIREVILHHSKGLCIIIDVCVRHVTDRSERGSEREREGDGGLVGEWESVHQRETV